MTIYAATGNIHKQAELSALFAPITVRIPRDDGISFSPEENGSTFMENSLVKAKALYALVREPIIADDSGICVDALDGRPGIFSARYRGRGEPPSETPLSDSERNRLLLEEAWEAAGAAGTARDTLTCRFVCAMTLYFGGERAVCVQETVEGRLVESFDRIQGCGGFGYDPIVFLPGYGKTIAELTEEEKNLVSHRGRAARAIKRILLAEGSF